MLIGFIGPHEDPDVVDQACDIAIQGDQLERGRTIMVPLEPWNVRYIRHEMGMPNRREAYNYASTLTDGYQSYDYVDEWIDAKEIVHVAIQQGELAARPAAGVKRLKPVDYSLLLNVVFTDPQLATVGRLERELVAEGIPHLVASYPFNDHGKSILMDANYGYVKVIAEPKRGRILGAEIVGKDAGELIHAFSGPLAMRATVFDLLRAPWYHPTLAEIVTYPLEEIAENVLAR